MSKDNKEQDILRAAEKMFVLKGFKGATTNLIATEAGVTHAMLHYYFRTKDQIFLKVLDLYVEQMRTELKALMEEDVYDIDVIGRVTEVVFDFFNSHRRHVALFLEVAGDRPDLLDSYVSDFGRFIGTAFTAHSERTRRAVEKGQIRDISFQSLFADIVSVCSSTLFFEPVLDNLFKLDPKAKESFIADRRREAVLLITGRLKTTE